MVAGTIGAWIKLLPIFPVSLTNLTLLGDIAKEKGLASTTDVANFIGGDYIHKLLTSERSENIYRTLSPPACVQPLYTIR